MKETCSNIYLCSDMRHMKSRVTSFDQHLTEVPSFKKGCLTFLSEPIISEVSEKYCKSFSSYWRVVEKKLRTTKLDWIYLLDEKVYSFNTFKCFSLSFFCYVCTFPNNTLRSPNCFAMTFAMSWAYHNMHIFSILSVSF